MKRLLSGKLSLAVIALMFVSYSAAWAQPPATVNVLVDIKPGSCINPFNVKSKGVVPVVILGSTDVDVTQIDPLSITLAGVKPIRSKVVDVATPPDPAIGCEELGPDGFADLALKFRTQDIVAVLDPTVKNGDTVVLTLTGTLVDEVTPIQGEDSILVKKPGKKK